MAIFDTLKGIFKKDDAEVSPASETAWKSSYVDGDIDEAKVAYDIKKEFDERREKRVTRELQWQLNKEFLTGNQYCDINTVSRAVEEIPFSYDDEEREIFNLTAPKIEARLSKLNKVKPALMARPASDAHRDISTAKVSTKALRGTYNMLKMQDQFKSANAWAEQTGTVFHKDIWNPAIGKVVSSENDEVVHEGNIQHIVVNSFEVYPESEYVESEQLQSIFHAKPFTIDEVEMLYGLRTAGADLDVYNIENSRISVGGMGYTATIQKYAKGKIKNAALVIEAYYPRCKKYPNGKMITVVGGRVVVYMDNPYIDDEGNPYIPLTKQVCVREPGCFYGRTIIERLIPVQRRYNALKNRIHEYINRTVIPAWNVEQDTIVDMESLQANGVNSGDFIQRTPGSQPAQPLQMPHMDNTPIIEEQNLRNLFTEISGVSDFASQSSAPSGTPGVGLELMKQQDDSRVSLTSENIEIAAKEIGIKWLWLYKQYVKLPRMTKVVGDEYTLPYIQEWSENDLTTFDVTLETEDLLTSSIPQKRQQVTYLLSQGLFHDPVSKQIIPSMRAKLFDMFELGNWEDAVSLDNLHIRRANEENAHFRRNMIPQLNALDDDDLHIREHTRFALTTEFEDLSEQNPELTSFMLEHITLHKNAMMQKGTVGQSQQAAQQPNQGSQPAPQATPSGGNLYGQNIAMSV